MALSSLPAERHLHVSHGFTDRVRGARSWDVPAPVAGWTARDVVRHLIEWLPPFLAAGSGILRRLLALPHGPRS
jgi:mycothiol maleylpyruvate isomerase-like protein